MSREKTLEELERENKELRAALERVTRAYEALGEAIKACPDISGSSKARLRLKSFWKNIRVCRGEKCVK